MPCLTSKLPCGWVKAWYWKGTLGYMTRRVNPAVSEQGAVDPSVWIYSPMPQCSYAHVWSHVSGASIVLDYEASDTTKWGAIMPLWRPLQWQYITIQNNYNDHYNDFSFGLAVANVCIIILNPACHAHCNGFATRWKHRIFQPILQTGRFLHLQLFQPVDIHAAMKSVKPALSHFESECIFSRGQAWI